MSRSLVYAAVYGRYTRSRAARRATACIAAVYAVVSLVFYLSAPSKFPPMVYITPAVVVVFALLSYFFHRRAQRAAVQLDSLESMNEGDL